MNNQEKRKLRQMCKLGWSFEDIRYCVHCCDVTIKNYMKIFSKENKNNLHELLTEFFQILNTVEETDSGREFHPVYISSCRVMKTKRVIEIISEIKDIINYNKD